MFLPLDKTKQINYIHSIKATNHQAKGKPNMKLSDILYVIGFVVFVGCIILSVTCGLGPLWVDLFVGVLGGTLFGGLPFTLGLNIDD